MAELLYVDAISQAMWEEMERDPSVFILGEDVAHEFGGAFKITKGFSKKFGDDRVINTPISESAIVGSSVGAALEGLRPIAEMQFSSFISCGFDQLVNVAGKAYYRWGGKVPMVVRAPYGGGIHSGPFHSSCEEAYFVHTPGLKVVAPSTAYDAKGLLIASIRDNNPVIYFEHKYLYRRIRDEVPEGPYVVPLGKADIKRPGDDVLVITYGAMVHVALESAAKLEEEGISVEVLDLRSLCPLDTEMILEETSKIGKVIVLHEANRSCGVGAEVSSIISEEAFRYLEAPIVRLTAPDTPVPFSTPLENYYLPDEPRVSQAIRDLFDY